MLSNDLVVHLRRWGVRRDADMRAQLLVVTALGLVHDVMIRLSGPQRARAKRETVRLLVAALPG